jgi:hypothetical protein
MSKSSPRDAYSADGAVALKAKICVDSWAGRREFPCEIMGETKTKYVCRMSGDGVLSRKYVRLGDVVGGWGRLKKRLAFTPKRKSKNWRNGNFGSIIRSSPSQKTNDAE